MRDLAPEEIPKDEEDAEAKELGKDVERLAVGGCAATC